MEDGPRGKQELSDSEIDIKLGKFVFYEIL